MLMQKQTTQKFHSLTMLMGKQTTPYPSDTQLLPHFSWLLHLSTTSYQKAQPNKQCLILQTHGFFHTSVGCCIRQRQVLKRLNQIKQRLTFWWQTKQIYWWQIRIQHLSIGCCINSDIKSWGSPSSIKHPSSLLRQFCHVDNHSKFWGSTSDACQFHADCWICYTRFLEFGLFIIRIWLCIINGNGLFIIEGKGCQKFPPLFCFRPLFCYIYSNFCHDYL